MAYRFPSNLREVLAMKQLPKRRVLSSLSRAMGRDVVLIEALPVAEGQTITLRFEGGQSEWRQGVWLATEGELEAGGLRVSQMVIWRDAVPSELTISVLRTDGTVHFYNVWDSGRGIRPFESQSASSGMLVTEVADRRIYESSDIAAEPKFDRLTFSVAIGDGARHRSHLTGP